MVALRSAAVFTLGWLAIVLISCEKVPEVNDDVNAVAVAKVAADLALPKIQSSIEKCAANQDTLTISYQKLQTYLPIAIAGYRRDGPPEGEKILLTGASYSCCAQTYRTGEGENPRTLKVTIIDYKGAAAMYTTATSLLGAGFAMEDDQQRIQSFNLGQPVVNAFETFHKLEHRATVSAGVANRFFVTVEADQQSDTDLVKQVALQMNLPKLAVR